MCLREGSSDVTQLQHKARPEPHTPQHLILTQIKMCIAL